MSCTGEGDTSEDNAGACRPPGSVSSYCIDSILGRRSPSKFHARKNIPPLSGTRVRSDGRKKNPPRLNSIGLRYAFFTYHMRTTFEVQSSC